MSFPTEILLTVFHLAYHGHSHLPSAEPDRATLVACSLVCSAWVSPAQSILLSNVSLPVSKTRRIYATMSRAGDVGAWNLDQSKDESASLVPVTCFARTLEIKGDVLDWDIFLSLLSLFSGVRRLVLTNWSLASPARDMVHGLHTVDKYPSTIIRCPSVTSLSVNVLGGRMPLAPLLDVFPNLESLGISGSPISVGILGHAPPKIALRELQIHIPFWSGDRQDELIPWLLRGATNAGLEILSLNNLPRPAILDHLVTARAGSIRSLRLPHIDMEDNEPATQHMRLVRACVALEELVIPFIPPFHLLAALPSSIQHVSFKNDYATRRVFDKHATNTIESVVQWADDGFKLSLPSLGLLTYTAEAYVAHEECEMLRSVCANKGVELRIFARSLGLYKGEVEACWPTARFPRHVPLNKARFAEKI